jgi:hypothetical protein
MNVIYLDFDLSLQDLIIIVLRIVMPEFFNSLVGVGCEEIL